MIFLCQCSLSGKHVFVSSLVFITNRSLYLFQSKYHRKKKKKKKKNEERRIFSLIIYFIMNVQFRFDVDYEFTQPKDIHVRSNFI